RQHEQDEDAVPPLPEMNERSQVTLQGWLCRPLKKNRATFSRRMLARNSCKRRKNFHNLLGKIFPTSQTIPPHTCYILAYRTLALFFPVGTIDPRDRVSLVLI